MISHIISGILILAITLVFGLLGIKKSDWQILNDSHSILGLMVLFAVTFIGLAGIATRTLMSLLYWKTNLIVYVKLFHKIFGVLIIGVS